MGRLFFSCRLPTFQNIYCLLLSAKSIRRFLGSLVYLSLASQSVNYIFGTELQPINLSGALNTRGIPAAVYTLSCWDATHRKLGFIS